MVSAVRLGALEEYPLVSKFWLDGLLYLPGLKRIEICDRRSYSSWSPEDSSETVAQREKGVREELEAYSRAGVEVIYYRVPR
jgi:hypothetical protein